MRPMTSSQIAIKEESVLEILEFHQFKYNSSTKEAQKKPKITNLERDAVRTGVIKKKA